ncbi:MAG: tRNA (N(6)-L-threonylcarbamoyladenosine(37)-C(2))-methylthiotransferase MtaB [Eubacteriales bacterium]|nr:tRNA (N(6)-L-threonylcarbamoyladenosine(37)-C(2))-methylthiotransferase MtaB [Eubacteriales bacterium]
MFRVAFQTLGCKTNHYESQSLAQRFNEAGFTLVPSDAEADLMILNSCTVTHEAGRKCEQQLRRYRRNFPRAKIAVMGCHSQLKDLGHLVDFQRGVMARLDILSWAKELRAEITGEHALEHLTEAETQSSAASQNKIGVARGREFESLGLLSEPGATRAVLKIQDGCELYCTYCAICLARGPVRSRARTEIFAEAKQLAESGIQEIVLTGIHLCSFELDKGRDSLALAELIEELAAIDGIERIRLGSLEPKSMTDEVLTRLASVKQLCPHFHLSLQSGSDTVLKRMRRQYTAAEYRSRVEKIRELFTRPAITTDLMVAFPEETEEEHQESMQYIRELELARLHIFRYSPRAKTAAARWPQVPVEIGKARAKEAQAVADFLLHKFLVKNFQARLSLLLEEEIHGHWEGYSENYIRCRLLDSDKEYKRGEIIEVEAVDIQSDILLVKRAL